MVSSPVACDRHVSDAQTLGLEPGESDPVRVILAAQLRLRQCRHGQVAGNRSTAAEVRRIIEARDRLLTQAVGSLTRRGTLGVMARRPITTVAASSARDVGRP